jgi:hypothetical protein
LHMAKKNCDESAWFRLTMPAHAFPAWIFQTAKPGISHQNYAFPRYEKRTRQKPIAG